MNGNDLLDTPSAARRLGVTPATLVRWRKNDAGPAWVRLGDKLVRYRESDLQAYLAVSSRRTPARTPRDPASMLLGAAA
jgi:predicted DNA-binding transcriptional regulator AlpA